MRLIRRLLLWRKLRRRGRRGKKKRRDRDRLKRMQKWHRIRNYWTIFSHMI